jgi:sugar O-acyltransferase (sialic acid O-acetyltransferase NeuD family)
MKKKAWTLFGAGNFLGEIIENIERNNGAVRLIVLNQAVSKEIEKRIPNNIRIIDLNDFKPSTDLYFFGFMDINKEKLLKALEKHKISFPNLIHPSAQIAKNVQLGQGNYIGPGVVLGCDVKIGNYNVINRCTSIGHDSVIDDLNKTGPAVTICSFCKIGKNNSLGASATIIEKLSIKDNITIGAGAVVVMNLIEKGTYIGVPAKLVIKNAG